MREKIAVLDFGGQYSHLIANRIRRLGVYSEIHLPDVSIDKLAEYKGIIFSGSPFSTLEENAPQISFDPRDLSVPLLGLCYGHQLIAKMLGGTISRGERREYGLAQMSIVQESPLFAGLSGLQQIWMSHGDAAEDLPDGFEIIGSTDDCHTAAVANESKKIYGMQYHPEVVDSINGMKMLENFLDICGCAKSWSPSEFLKELMADIIKQCGDRKVFLLVSGGVDSTVAFALLNKALGKDRVLGLHIDNGLMRHNESAGVMEFMKAEGFDNLRIADATNEFLSALNGLVEPEKKRVAIGNTFLKVKEAEEAKLGLDTDHWLLAQGTIYPDTIESAGTKHADKIKTHHNRVDIILEMIEKGLVIEPLAQLYKDEVRALGAELGIPHNLLWRHPFPGPGLGVRLLCSDVDGAGAEDVLPVEAKEILDAEGYRAQVLKIKSVGVQGDSRTYAHPAVVFGDIDWNRLELLSTRLTNSVKMINRVVVAVAVSEENPQYRMIRSYTTKERLDLLRKADNAVTEILNETGEYEKIWQMPVVLLPLVNRQGHQCVVLRPIVSQEAMTARFYPMSERALRMIIERFKKIDGLGDAFFDITHKPPGTIEWE